MEDIEKILDRRYKTDSKKDFEWNFMFFTSRYPKSVRKRLAKKYKLNYRR